MTKSNETTTSSEQSKHIFAEKIRAACIQAALDGYQNAAISGLCAEGAFEAAISAIRMLDVNAIETERTDVEN